MSDKKVLAVGPSDMNPTDITEKVQILYDIAHQSLDWGSGFLSNEEMEHVVQLAIIMGWQVPDLSTVTVGSPSVTVAQKFPDHYTIHSTDNPRYVDIRRVRAARHA